MFVRDVQLVWSYFGDFIMNSSNRVETALMETLSQLFIAKDLDYISDSDIAEIRPLIEHISAQLSVWRNNLDKE